MRIRRRGAGAVVAWMVLHVSGCGKPSSLPPVGITEVTASERAKAAAAPVDPLPSWRQGPTKDRILGFVAKVTQRGSPEFVAPSERTATFDNDGTLWQEKPPPELAFTMDRVRALVAADRSLMEREPFRAALERDTGYFAKQGERALVPLLVATHGGMTEDAFATDARAFFRTSVHPKFGIPYTALTYKPMIELMAYLRDKEFSVFVCSGGETTFMRAVTKEVYDLGPDRIMGSTMRRTSRAANGAISIFRERELASLNDKLTKPVTIQTRLGQPPLVAVGNVGTGGDVAMLEFSHGRTGPSLQMLIRHDDPEREFEYGADDEASLSAARNDGVHLVSMKRDWAKVFEADLARP